VNRSVLIGVGAASLVAAFVIGRATASAPSKVEECTRRHVEETVAAKVEEKRNEGTEQIAARVIVRRVPVPGPGCPPVEETVNETVTTRTFDLGDLRLNLDAKRTEDEETRKVTTRSRPGWRASVAADPLRLALDPSLFRFGVERRIVGPFWLGASYQHGGALLLSAAGEF
jgi:hypothetical protein